MSPRLPPARLRRPLAAQALDVPCWVPAGMRIRFDAAQRRHLDVAAAIASAIVIGTATSRLPSSRWRKTGEGGDAGDDVEVAGRTAERTVLALAGDPDPGAVVDPGGDLDAVALALHRQAGAAAGRARVLDDLAAAAALRAGLADREEALALRSRRRGRRSAGR